MKDLLARAAAAAAAVAAAAAASAAQAAVAACEAMQESSFPAGAVAGVVAAVAAALALLCADGLQSHAAALHTAGSRTAWASSQQAVCPVLGPWAATVERQGAHAGEGWEAAAAFAPAKLESVNGGKRMGGA